MQICRLMIRKKYGFRWFSYFRCANADEEAFDLIADGAFHIYELDMAAHSQWQGQGITTLRLDPVDVSGADFAVDYIQSQP